MQKEVFLKNLGEHIKKLREERNHSQGKPANIINKEGQSLQRVEAEHEPNY